MIFVAVVGCAVGPLEGALEMMTGAEMGQVTTADDTVSEMGEVTFGVEQGGAAEEELEQTITVLGVVGGDTTV